jgi:dTDP-glucose 4,6-dehydratase
LSQDYPVVNFDKLTYAGNLANLDSVASNPHYTFIEGDICDPGAVEAAMSGCHSVVHFAAESDVDRSIYDPAPMIETNVTGTFVLLLIARKLHIEKFVHVSTDEVFGDMAPGTFAAEDSPVQPSSPYSASKGSSDLIVRSCVRTFGFPTIIIRASNNYGPFQFPEKFLPLMIASALDDEPLPIYGDGKQERNWLHVQDHCRGILAVLERGRIGEVYNIGGADVVEKSHHGAPFASRHRKTSIANFSCGRPSRPRPPLCAYLLQDRAGARLEARHFVRRRPAPNH